MNLASYALAKPRTQPNDNATMVSILIRNLNLDRPGGNSCFLSLNESIHPSIHPLVQQCNLIQQLNFDASSPQLTPQLLNMVAIILSSMRSWFVSSLWRSSFVRIQLRLRRKIYSRSGSRYLGRFVSEDDALCDWLRVKTKVWEEVVANLASIAPNFPQAAYSGLQKYL